MLDCSVDVSFLCVDSKKGEEASGSFALTKKQIRLCNEGDLFDSQSSLLMICFELHLIKWNTNHTFTKHLWRVVPFVLVVFLELSQPQSSEIIYLH